MPGQPTHLDSPRALLALQLRELHAAECLQVGQLRRWRTLVEELGFGNLLGYHLQETLEQIMRLEVCLVLLDLPVGTTAAPSMRALLEERPSLTHPATPRSLIDLDLLARCRQIERAELTLYGNARMLASALAEVGIVRHLEASMAEEQRVDAALVGLADDVLIPTAIGRGSNLPRHPDLTLLDGDGGEKPLGPRALNTAWNSADRKRRP